MHASRVFLHNSCSTGDCDRGHQNLGIREYFSENAIFLGLGGNKNLRGHPLSMYAKFSEKLTFLTPCAYQGVRNVGFSENFAFVLNG